MEVDPAATVPRTILIVVPIIEPTIPMIVIPAASATSLTIAIRPIAVPDQVSNQTTEAALARTMTSITIEHIEQVVEHGERLSSLRSWVQKTPAASKRMSQGLARREGSRTSAAGALALELTTAVPPRVGTWVTPPVAPQCTTWLQTTSAS